MDVILWRAGLAKINSGVPGYVLQTNIHTEIGTGTRTEAWAKNIFLVCTLESGHLARQNHRNKKLYWEINLLGRITTLVLCRQSPLNLHQFRLTRDSKYGLVGTDQNVICWYFALIRLYVTFCLLCQFLSLYILALPIKKPSQKNP